MTLEDAARLAKVRPEVADLLMRTRIDRGLPLTANDPLTVRKVATLAKHASGHGR
jgi:hypothetical protein